MSEWSEGRPTAPHILWEADIVSASIAWKSKKSFRMSQIGQHKGQHRYVGIVEMPSKVDVFHGQPQPFNDRAHVILSDVLDEAEQWLVRSGKCQAHETDEYLTIAFIKESGLFLEHATGYLENDGRIAADLFLWKLPKGKAKARYVRNDLKCALQLHWHTTYYFRRYHMILRQTSLHLLRTLPDIAAIDRSGVLMLAAANLPGVRTDIRRERRFRGANYDRTIVADNTLRSRISYGGAFESPRKLP